MHLSHRRMAIFSVTGCTAWVMSVASLLLHESVLAQVPESGGGQSSEVTMGTLPLIPSASAIGTPGATTPNSSGGPNQSNRWFEPRITIQHTVTSNARLNSAGHSDHVTEVMPGFSLMRDTARVKGFVDYTLRASHYARGTDSDKIWHSLNARGTVEAVEDRLYVDMDGTIGLQAVSAFGPIGNSAANSNMAETSNFRISPYLKGDLSGGINYEARYGIREIRSDAAINSDATVHDWLLQLGRKPVGQAFGWVLDATQQNINYSNSRNIESTAFRGRLIYLATLQLRLIGIAGFESTNQRLPTKESHDIVGLGFDWRPSDKSKLFVERQSRYFGSAYNVNLEHRLARAVWRYTDRKDVTVGTAAQSGSTGSLFDLLDGYYTQIEPSPIRRIQLVQAELARMGLPADMQVFPDFLSSSSKLQRQQQLSLALLGRRSTLTFALSRSDARQMDGTLQLGDDFQNNQRIHQRGWNIMFAHRLSPNSTINAAFGDTRSIGSTLGWEARTRTLLIGWNTRIAPRTSLGLQLRRVLSDGNMSQYDESAVMGLITHRF